MVTENVIYAINVPINRKTDRQAEQIHFSLYILLIQLILFYRRRCRHRRLLLLLLLLHSHVKLCMCALLLVSFNFQNGSTRSSTDLSWYAYTLVWHVCMCVSKTHMCLSRLDVVFTLLILFLFLLFFNLLAYSNAQTKLTNTILTLVIDFYLVWIINFLIFCLLILIENKQNVWK